MSKPFTLTKFQSDWMKLQCLIAKKQEMIDHLVREKKFNPKGAVIAIDNFLKTLKYVLIETGKLP